MERSRRYCTAASFFLFALCFPSGLFCQSREVLPNVMYAVEMDLTEGYTDYLSYSVSVPENAAAMKISIFHSSADLDIFLNYEEEVETYDSSLLYGISENFNEELFFTRFSEVPLKAGTYYFDIVYQRKKLPEQGSEVITTLPFSFKVELFTEEVERDLSPGVPYTTTLYPAKGMFTTFTLTVPPQTEALRLDLSGSAADLDLFVQYGAFVKGTDGADYAAESLLSRESLLITRKSSKQLKEGTYYITVLDQLAAEYPVEFTIHSNFTEVPPDALATLPELPRPASLLERVLYSTVEIIGQAGKGSGCIVSPDGLVVTNFHVIQGNTGNPEKHLAVAVTRDVRVPPDELFRAEVLDTDTDRDLALLRITSDFFGRRLPPGYVFPYLLINSDADYRIGDTVSCAGYPGIGGTGSRASVTFTRGVISGFEKAGYGTLLKTDGLINSGSSGGAAVDKYFKLIGLPAIIMEEASGQLGFILPISLFPAEWIEMAEGEQKN
jgi:S1-C subfamily serine protease